MTGTQTTACAETRHAILLRTAQRSSTHASVGNAITTTNTAATGTWGRARATTQRAHRCHIAGRSTTTAKCTDCDNYDSSCRDWNWQTCECNDSCCGDCGSGKYCANCECVCENADDQYYCNNWDSENCWCNDTACPPCYGYQEPGTCSCDCSAYYCDEGYTMGDDCGCY